MMATTERAYRRSWHPRMWLVIGAIIALPAIAMLFTSEVRWDAADFVAIMVLLAGAGLAYEAISLVTRSRIAQSIAGVALITGVLIVWADGAVGIF